MPDHEITTPVAFFIFNRPDTTRRVFSEIARARPPRLLVVADGPREGRAREEEYCRAARSVATKVDWPCEILTNYSDVNLGCKKRISSGLDWVFDLVEEAILLEDDCMPHPSFFRYCELLLDRYREDERVMMITGTNYLLDKAAIRESYYFSRYYSIWGWATWRRAWRKYDITMKDWNLLKTQDQLKCFYSRHFVRKHMTRMFDMAFNDAIDTWDIQWFYACLFNNGLSIVPARNLIANVGREGTHTSGDFSNNDFPVFPFDGERVIHPNRVAPSHVLDDRFFGKYLKGSFMKSFYNIIRTRTRRWGLRA